ncbi:uncharacterized protein LOC111328710 [Stylophora pistillata]|uniref:uncharacterized protein LOC111328710 n=1 Tax=Stylophora pistillata TaxID=50429 RepID=UPI000C043581|nr:uncharacterized protein LOC111328710 [Stylophora pistillata]
MNQRSLKRRLKDYEINRRETVDEELKERVRDLILQEICTGPNSLNVYRTMWHVLRVRHRINVPRRLVESLLREVDPRGVEHRKSRCLQRRTILWLEVQPSNKNPRCVTSYFVKHVKAAHGCPVRVYTDPGTENGLIVGIQCYLRAEGLDEYAGSKSHKHLSSNKNQHIECQWSHYRKQRSSWWIDFFNDLHESDILDLTSDLHKEAIWFCFADLLQTDLDKVKEYWNSHRIRKSKHATVSGVPDMMYFLPEDFGHSDCLASISPHKLTEMENRFDGFDVEDDECNPVFPEYFQYVIDNNGLSHPTSIHRAGVQIEKLIKFAKGEVVSQLPSLSPGDDDFTHI